jgi:tetratricopeptide (TPR) repeat protein
LGVSRRPSREGSSPSSASTRAISCCIAVFYITGFAAFRVACVTPEIQAPSATDDPDALYAARENLESARRAAAIWTRALARDPADFTSAWKLARARYWLGGHASGDQVKQEFEAGVTAARQAMKLKPARPEGHFWLAANLGGLAETQGRLTGLKHRTEIRESLQRVLTIDPAFQQGSADRALGRWYSRVPRLFGGSKSKSEAHLRRSLEYNPNSTASLFFLAEALLDADRDSEASTLLRRLLAAPLDPEWGPEDREFKAKAARLLASIRPRD